MSLDQIIILSTGIAAIAFVAWYFFGKKEEVVTVTGTTIPIKVEAGYSPSTIVLQKNQPVTLKITRTDPSDCLEEIVIPDFKIKQHLPLNKEVQISLDPKEAGEFRFQCGMNMFHGKIVVRE